MIRRWHVMTGVLGVVLFAAGLMLELPTATAQVVTGGWTQGAGGGGGAGVGDANTWTAAQSFNVTDSTAAIEIDSADYIDFSGTDDVDWALVRYDGSNLQLGNGRLTVAEHYIGHNRQTNMDSGGRFGTTGTVISDSYAASASLDFASVPANECADLSITVTGAAANDVCAVGAPASPQGHFSFTCYVSAADTAQVRACNHTAGAVDPAAATYAVRVWDP